VAEASPAEPTVQNQMPKGTARPPAIDKDEKGLNTILAKTSKDIGTPKMGEKDSETFTPGQPNRPFDKKKALYEVDGPAHPYSVYLGSYKTLDRAKKDTARHQGQGVNAYWVKVDLGEKGIWYRVFAGHFRTEKEAGAFLKNKRLKDAVVKRLRYSNLIGVFSSKKELERRSALLSQMGYGTYVLEARNGKFQLYSGAFYTKVGAENHSKELASKKVSSMVVER
jgi:hypothetical protein